MSRKGGSGKSTTAMNMAARFSAGGYKVSLMDFDDQKTLSKWYERRDSYLGPENKVTLVETDKKTFADDYKNLTDKKCDVLIIDTPPRLTPFHKNLLDASDFVLVPIKTTMEDLETVAEVVDMIEQEEKSYGFVINETKNQTLLYLSIKEVLVEYGAVLGTVSGTVNIPEASIKGLALCEYKSDNINCQQYDKVFSNLDRRLKNKKKHK